MRRWGYIHTYQIAVYLPDKLTRQLWSLIRKFLRRLNDRPVSGLRLNEAAALRNRSCFYWFAFYSRTIHHQFRKYNTFPVRSLPACISSGRSVRKEKSVYGFCFGACHSSMLACEYTTLYFFGGVNRECLC